MNHLLLYGEHLMEYLLIPDIKLESNNDTIRQFGVSNCTATDS